MRTPLQPPPEQYTRQHLDAAMRLLHREIDGTEFRQQSGIATSSPPYTAFAILREMVRRGLVVVDVCPPLSEMLPRLCDGAIIEDDEAA